MFIITRAVSTPRDIERRESGSMFCETIEIISWSSYESSRKHENSAEKYRDWTMKFTHSPVKLIPVYPLYQLVSAAPVSQRSWVQIPYGPEFFSGPIYNYSFQ